MKRVIILSISAVSIAALSFWAGENKHLLEQSEANNIQTQRPTKTLAPDPSPQLEKIFNISMIGVQRTYLESITGPAKYQDTRDDGVKNYTYPFHGCEIKAYEADGKIQGYSMPVSKSCSPDISSFVPDINHSLADVTMGQFSNSINVKPVADCLESCGNSIMSNIGLISFGAHSNDYINIEVFNPLDNDASINAASQWSNSMGKPQDGVYSDYVIEGKFNCDNKYDDAALNAVKNLPIKFVYVGQGISDIASRALDGCRPALP